MEYLIKLGIGTRSTIAIAFITSDLQFQSVKVSYFKL